MNKSKIGNTNSIIDVSGISVGQYTDPQYTGTTVVISDNDHTVGGVSVMGAAPGTRETDVLNPISAINDINAVVLSGGSAFGLDTASGVMSYLEANGIGHDVNGGVVPIIPAAILFDLGRFGRDFSIRPDSSFGLNACENESNLVVDTGNIGAGSGALIFNETIKCGLGTASTDLGDEVIVGAIVAVNALGSTFNTETGDFYAKYLELENEFEKYNINQAQKYVIDIQPKSEFGNTTIAVVATNVSMDKSQITKIAQMAQDGLARAIVPVHTMYDGDTVFALSTGTINMSDLINNTDSIFSVSEKQNISIIGSEIANTLSRAIIHATLSADSVGSYLSYNDMFPNTQNELYLLDTTTEDIYQNIEMNCFL